MVEDNFDKPQHIPTLLNTTLLFYLFYVKTFFLYCLIIGIICWKTFVAKGYYLIRDAIFDTFVIDHTN